MLRRANGAMIDDEHPLLLGSASPRRRQLLATVGIPTLVRPVVVDEAWQREESADGYLARVVASKLDAVVALPTGALSAVLVADTVVICDGRLLGKPGTDADARDMLRQLSGRAHQVSTRFAVVAAARRAAPAWSETVTTVVHFRDLSAEHIARYVATGEGRDKAGAYAIQGIGGFAVKRIVGSYSNVVGLPLCEVVAALEHLGQLASFPFAAVTNVANGAADRHRSRATDGER